MECKSIQSSSSSSTIWKYDVFVSFGDEDTRNNFTAHLFAAFRRKGIAIFKDDRKLKQGGHIPTKLMQAIEGSQVLIVVFSKNYATSSWCLEELAKIADCVEVPRGQIVLPVFYDVNPSEVRKQSGDYEKAFVEHEKKFKQDLWIVQRWREALAQVANLSGWDVQNKPQNTEIEKIVERVIKSLSYKLSTLDRLVGMDPRVEQLQELLNMDSNYNVQVVGICGMGGIGKTALARVVYDINFLEYPATCFIDDVSKVYRDTGPIGVQKCHIHQIQGEEIQDIWHFRAKYMIKSILCRQKAFIVLDNVDTVEQLEKLDVNRKYLPPGSKIIITSRDRHLLYYYGVDIVYDVQLLSKDEALLLFCRTTFELDYVMEGYEELTYLALEYAQCLPLAIKVLGSHLQGRITLEWRSALASLRDNPNKDIMDVLQITFDQLELMEKEMFLDIACFFPNGTSKEYLMRILDCCGYFPHIGIQILVDKSLITIRHSAIEMHDLLRELGTKFVQKKAPNEPREWSRLWRYKDFRSVMYEKTAMNNLKAICLESPRTEENITLRAEVLSRMNRLRLLILSGVNFSGSLNCLSDDLHYLKWVEYPFTYLSSSCEMIMLVELSLPHSNITQLWEGTKPLYSLRIMVLHGSKNLVKTPDFSEAPNLEKLDLEGCTKLVHIHPSIGHLKKLGYFNLKNCTSLTSLPNSIFCISSLKVLNVARCSKLFNSKL